MFNNTKYEILSCETKTEFMWLSLRLSLRIFVNMAPDVLLLLELTERGPGVKIMRFSLFNFLNFLVADVASLGEPGMQY